MHLAVSLPPDDSRSPVHGRARRRLARWVAIAIAVYLACAYVVLPTFWRHYEHLPAMADMPKFARAPNGLPGDALNVALVGSEAEIQGAFAAAGWHPADPITLRSSLGIAESVVLDRPDPDAPVSNLLLFGRRQDLAFEKDVGSSARERNHVRFWRTDLLAGADRPVWIGAATFDRGVGLSHTTGQITHHIAPDIDAERDTLMHVSRRRAGSAPSTTSLASGRRSAERTAAAIAILPTASSPSGRWRRRARSGSR